MASAEIETFDVIMNNYNLVHVLVCDYVCACVLKWLCELFCTHLKCGINVVFAWAKHATNPAELHKSENETFNIRLSKA